MSLTFNRNHPGARALGPLEPHARIVDAVTDTIREAILDGVIAPGSALSVPELSRRLNVSRSPIREAVLQLVGEGLAVEQPRRGVSVAIIDRPTLIEIHETRLFLEGGAARLAAERAGTDLGDTLEAILAYQARAVAARDVGAWQRTDLAFHTAIAGAAGNPTLSHLVRRLEGRMRLALRGLGPDAAHMTEGLAEHQAIAAALGQRDGDAAETSMRAHIAATIARAGGA